MELENHCIICNGNRSDENHESPRIEWPKCAVQRVLFHKEIVEVLNELGIESVPNNPIDKVCKQCDIILMKIYNNSHVVDATRVRLKSIINNSMVWYGVLSVLGKDGHIIKGPVTCLTCHANLTVYTPLRPEDSSSLKRNSFRLHERLDESTIQVSGLQVLEKLNVSVSAEQQESACICRKCCSVLKSTARRLRTIEKSTRDLQFRYMNATCPTAKKTAETLTSRKKTPGTSTSRKKTPGTSTSREKTPGTSTSLKTTPVGKPPGTSTSLKTKSVGKPTGTSTSLKATPVGKPTGTSTTSLKTTPVGKPPGTSTSLKTTPVGKPPGTSASLTTTPVGKTPGTSTSLTTTPVGNTPGTSTSLKTTPVGKPPGTSSARKRTLVVTPSTGKRRCIQLQTSFFHNYSRPSEEAQASSSISTENIPPTGTNATGNVPPSVTDANENVPLTVTDDAAQDDEPPDPKNSKTPVKTEIAKAQEHFFRCKYRQGIRTFYRHSDGFRRALREFVADMVYKDLEKMCNKSTPSVWRTSQERQKAYTEFDWDEALIEAERDCPMLFTAIRGAVTPPKERDQFQSSDNLTKERKAVATTFGMLAYTKNPKRMNLLQQFVGAQLWLSDSNPGVFNCLNSLGMSLSKTEASRFPQKASISAVEKLTRIKQDVESSWKQARSEELAAAERRRNKCHGYAYLPTNSLDEDVPMTSVNAAMDETETEDVEMMSEAAVQTPVDENTEQNTSMQAVSTHRDRCPKPPEITNLGYSIMFGNVKLIRATSLTYHKEKDVRDMFQAHAMVDRVPSMHLKDSSPTPADTNKINPAVCLPNARDYQSLRRSYLVVVQRILTRLMPCFKPFAGTVTEHIPHQFSEESSRKSQVLPLGVQQKDDTKTMEDIFQNFQEAGIPGVTDPITTILYINFANLKNFRDAQKACIDGPTKWDRLEGLRPAVQEHHKQARLMEDTYRMLYDANSTQSVGTLAYIKDKYKRVFDQDGFDPAESSTTRLLRFSTEAYVVAAACSFMSLQDPCATPTFFPNRKKSTAGYFRKVANTIVNAVCKPPILARSDEETYCFCKSRKEDTMVYCENEDCDRGSWFHLSCLDLSPENLPQEFYCSKKCAQACSKDTVPPSDQDNIDHVFEYSKALLSRGLDEMVRHDAISENDGSRMLIHWKFDVLDFLSKNHPEYFLEGCSLLFDVNGGTSRRIAHQLQWNRTVNPTGGPGCNIAIDLYLDKLNHQYKQMFLNWKGMPVDFRARQFNRGMLQLHLEFQRILDTVPSDECDSMKKSKKLDKTSNILALAKLLVENQCLQKIPRRCHDGLADFVFQRVCLKEDKVLAKATSLKKRTLMQKTSD